VRHGGLIAAFCLGVIPGLLLYWSNRQPPVVMRLPAAAKAEPVASVPPAPAAAPLLVQKEERRNLTSSLPTENLGELHRLMTERGQQLQAAQATQTELTKQLQEVEGKLAAVTQQEAARKVAEAELHELLGQVQKESEALKVAAQSRETAYRELESNSQQLKRRATEDTQRTNRRNKLAAEVEELGRQREAYLSNILGRYREATDLFRAMSLRLDNPRDAGSPLSNDLSRIQQAVQLADEDLRQLRLLNAQAIRLRKELN